MLVIVSALPRAALDRQIILPRIQPLNQYRQAKPETWHFPVVGILLYRKHVVTKQPYIPQLIRHFEKAGLTPLPIFINGVEGHVAVRAY